MSKQIPDHHSCWKDKRIQGQVFCKYSVVGQGLVCRPLAVIIDTNRDIVLSGFTVTSIDGLPSVGLGFCMKKTETSEDD